MGGVRALVMALAAAVLWAAPANAYMSRFFEGAVSQTLGAQPGAVDFTLANLDNASGTDIAAFVGGLAIGTVLPSSDRAAWLAITTRRSRTSSRGSSKAAIRSAAPIARTISSFSVPLTVRFHSVPSRDDAAVSLAFGRALRLLKRGRVSDSP